MKRAVVFAVVIVIVAGGLFLSTRNIVPQHHLVEKVLPNDKFLK